MVFVDPDGRLGTVLVGAATATPTPTATPSGGHPGEFSPKGVEPQAIPDAANQAMIDLEVQSLEATISQQQNQIEILSAQVKEQIAEIQKVNARIQVKKSAAKNIVNKPKAVP
jgi:uncharacterized coiled-coil protein SlyX